MPYHVSLAWKIFGPVCNTATSYKLGCSPLFGVTTGKSVLQDVGGNIASSFFPLVLTPTPITYNAIRPILLLGCSKGKKFPLTISFPNQFGALTSRVCVNLAIHVYGRYPCLSLQCSDVIVPDEVDFFELQNLANQVVLTSLAKQVLAIVINGDAHAKEYSGDLKVYPCMRISADAATPDLSREQLVGIVTRHPEVRAGVVTAVFEKNEPHQIDSTTLLLDRQGMISFVPQATSEATKRANARRVRSCFAMLELGAAASRHLRSLTSHPDERVIQYLTPLCGDPRGAIPNSTTAQRAWQVFAEEFDLYRAFEEGKQMTVEKKPSDDTAQAPVQLSGISTPSLPSITGKKSVLCVTAASTEFRAVRTYFTSLFGAEGVARIETGDEESLFEYRDPVNGVTWYLGGQSFQGETEAAVYAKGLQAKIGATIVLMVGMCMGMPKKRLEVGTVIVPNEVFVFDHQRITPSGTQYRPHGRDVVNGLQNIARLASTDNDLAFTVLVDKGLASASIKIEHANSNLVKFIESTFPDAVAFDMEGWGFYRAGKNSPFLWIKAVADWGESQSQDLSNQDAKRGIQANVTANAAAFAVKVARSYFSSRVIS